MGNIAYTNRRRRQERTMGRLDAWRSNSVAPCAARGQDLGTYGPFFDGKCQRSPWTEGEMLAANSASSFEGDNISTSLPLIGAVMTVRRKVGPALVGCLCVLVSSLGF